MQEIDAFILIQKNKLVAVFVAFNAAALFRLIGLQQYVSSNAFSQSKLFIMVYIYVYIYYTLYILHILHIYNARFALITVSCK